MWQEIVTALQAIIITLTAITSLLAATHKILTLTGDSVKDLLQVIKDLNKKGT